MPSLQIEAWIKQGSGKHWGGWNTSHPEALPSCCSPFPMHTCSWAVPALCFLCGGVSGGATNQRVPRTGGHQGAAPFGSMDGLWWLH